ncbi:hypothetical protein QN277_019555 [Acacia crassicarpa]|uniref:FAS1 domain-containing protein n=1 Tax=Acacia crassicarpa TaxID=499986 RepID=A0AAE1KDJ6_9FABA|nr:hypothetical protein QN277_019555 [Acacia crassicarpa]
MENLCVVIFFLFFSLSAIANPPLLSLAVQTPPPISPVVKTPPPLSPVVKTPPPLSPEVQAPPPISPAMQAQPPISPVVKTPSPPSPAVQAHPPVSPVVQAHLPVYPVVQAHPPVSPVVKTPSLSPEVQTPTPFSPAVHAPPPLSPAVQAPPLLYPAVKTPPPLSTAVQTPPPQQVRNIIDALIGAGDFTSWVTILSLANPLMLPMSTTLFIPQDGSDLISDNHPSKDPLLFPYHIVPQRLSFSDLLLFKPYTRIPTLLPAMSIVITNSSRLNFTLNDIPMTHPNLYNTDSISVHGIAAVLDYSVFGYSFPLLPPPTTAGNQVSEVLPPLPSPSEGILTPPFMPIGDPSDSACSCTEAPIVFLIFCGVLAFKMQRIPYIR